MRELKTHRELMSLNSATIRKQAPLNEIIEVCAKRGIPMIDPWRDQVQAVGIDKIARQLRDSGIKLSGYCRGGFYTAVDNQGFTAALEDNRRAIDEAKTVGAPCLVLVVGALPGALTGKPLSHNMVQCRAQVEDGIAASLQYAKSVGMPLAIEPLHPMQAAERACVNTLEHALDLCEKFDPDNTGALGVALDAYHVWWDPKLAGQIERAGSKRILAYHVCDWLVPTKDLVNDRGMMGDGVIELKRLREMVEATGYAGPVEVELFSDTWWGRPLDDVLDTAIARFTSVC